MFHTHSPNPSHGTPYGPPGAYPPGYGAYAHHPGAPAAGAGGVYAAPPRKTSAAVKVLIVVGALLMVAFGSCTALVLLAESNDGSTPDKAKALSLETLHDHAAEHNGKWISLGDKVRANAVDPSGNRAITLGNLPNLLEMKVTMLRCEFKGAGPAAAAAIHMGDTARVIGKVVGSEGAPGMLLVVRLSDCRLD